MKHAGVLGHIGDLVSCFQLGSNSRACRGVDALTTDWFYWIITGVNDEKPKVRGDARISGVKSAALSSQMSVIARDCLRFPSCLGSADFRPNLLMEGFLVC